MDNIAATKSSKGKIPLWIYVVFFTTLFVAISSFGISQYQQRQAESSLAQQSKVEELKQAILLQDDVINTNWLHTLNPLVKDVKGNILWSSKEKQGIVTLSKLPKLKANQQYHLWIYDLNTKNNKAVSALVFKPNTRDVILPFNPQVAIIQPFKFEIMLEIDGVEDGLSLLLAQP